MSFLSSSQRQKYFIWTLVVLLFIGGVMVWYGYFREDTISFFQPKPLPPTEITIDFRIFDDPIFEELGIPVSEIPIPEPGRRVNPFVTN